MRRVCSAYCEQSEVLVLCLCASASQLKRNACIVCDGLRDDVHVAIAAARLSTSSAESESVLSRLEKQLQDIDRAEARHKQQLAQQRRFHAKMMREGVGQLYRDKRAVAPSDTRALETSAPRDSSGATRLITWSSAALRALLQLVLVALTTLAQSLRRTKAKEM